MLALVFPRIGALDILIEPPRILWTLARIRENFFGLDYALARRYLERYRIRNLCAFLGGWRRLFTNLALYIPARPGNK